MLLVPNLERTVIFAVELKIDHFDNIKNLKKTLEEWLTTK